MEVLIIRNLLILDSLIKKKTWKKIGKNVLKNTKVLVFK